jgi:signal peptide peptidase SppA
MTSNLWLGTQTSYDAVVEAKVNTLAKYGDEKEDHSPMLLTKQDGVGIIDITGSLVDGKAGFMSFFGVTGYVDIREALIAAVADQEVSSILLNVNSGGGAVSGVHETAQLIQRVDKVKPVVAYTGGVEASAALWLGSSARYAFTGETAVTGSLGVITVHAERSKQLAQDGVKVTIVRAGSEKALANPYEPLSDKAKEGLQNRADAIYDVFLSHVAASRNLSNTAADTKFGQGKEFVGKQAVEAGLFDKVGTLEDAFTKAKSYAVKSAKTQASRSNQPVFRTGAEISAPTTAKIGEVSVQDAAAVDGLSDNLANLEGTQMSKPFTQEQLVALAAGVTLEAAIEAPAGEAPAADQAPTETTEQSPAADAQSTDLVAYLKEQNATATADLVKTTAELELAKTTLAAATASITALSEIVKASAKTMAVGLGEKTQADTLDAATLVAEHARLATAFKSKFKVGAVAATNTSDEGQPKPTKAKVDPIFAYAAKSLN